MIKIGYYIEDISNSVYLLHPFNSVYWICVKGHMCKRSVYMVLLCSANFASEIILEKHSFQNASSVEVS